MINWDPWRDLFGLPREMSQWLNEQSSAISSGDSAPSVYLPLDIRQTDKEFILEASVPGFDPKDIQVVAEQGVLTIRGEHQSETKPEGRYLRRERRQLSFFRQISLPQEVHDDDIRASFENGVLTVHIPRVEAPAPRRVNIEVNSGTKTLEGAGKAVEVQGAKS
ncbi:MAG: Hsp20/alpha crystallin family protein [Candidatus Dormiibacterota bacterium]